MSRRVGIYQASRVVAIKQIPSSNLVRLGEIKRLLDHHRIAAVDLALVLGHRAPYRRIEDAGRRRPDDVDVDDLPAFDRGARRNFTGNSLG
jgi:hypothetical protein